MRVLMVTNMYPEPTRPAWGSFIETQVKSLEANGVVAEVFVIEGYRGILQYLLAIPRLRKVCKQQHFDLVHAHYGLSGMVARAQFKFPLILSFCGDDLYGHSNDSGKATLQSLPLAWLQRHLARYVDNVIVKSKAMAKLIAPTPSVVPNGVDLDHFQPHSESDCRTELGLDEDKRYLLFPYNPQRPRKNFRLLQDAIEILANQHNMECEPLVVYDVPNAQMPTYINAADAMVLTSFWEGSPNAVKEAMACNTRIAAVDVGDVRELIGDQAACAVTTFDPTDLAAKIAAILGEPKPDIRSSMQWLSINAIAHTILGIYRATIVKNKKNRVLG